MSFHYLTSPSFPSNSIQTPLTENSLPPLSPSSSSMSSSRSQSRHSSPTPEVYHLLYKTLGQKWKNQGDELEERNFNLEEEENVRSGSGSGSERQGEGMNLKEGEGEIVSKRKRSLSIDQLDENTRKLVKVESFPSLPPPPTRTRSKILHRRRSSLPNSSLVSTFSSTTKPETTTSKPLLFSLNDFLKLQSYSVPSSRQTSPLLGPTFITTTTTPSSLPLTRSTSTSSHSNYNSNTPNTRSSELSSVVRSFEKVLNERAEGWKRLEEYETVWNAREVDNWYF